MRAKAKIAESEKKLRNAECGMEYYSVASKVLKEMCVGREDKLADLRRSIIHYEQEARKNDKLHRANRELLRLTERRLVVAEQIAHRKADVVSELEEKLDNAPSWGLVAFITACSLANIISWVLR